MFIFTRYKSFLAVFPQRLSINVSGTRREYKLFSTAVKVTLKELTLRLHHDFLHF